MLHSMLQYHVFSDSLDLAKVLIALGTSEGPSNSSVAAEGKKQRKQYYEPAFQLGLDMLQRLKQWQEIVIALINEQQVMKALDFALDYSVHSMKLSIFLDAVEQMRAEGNEAKASPIIKRLQEIKMFDQSKIKQQGYKPILIEE